MSAWADMEPQGSCSSTAPRPPPPPGGTHDEHVATDHQAEVPGEGAHKVHQGWAEVGGPCEHQALGAEEGKGEGHEPSGRSLRGSGCQHRSPPIPTTYWVSLPRRTAMWPPAGPCTLWASSSHL